VCESECVCVYVAFRPLDQQQNRTSCMMMMEGESNRRISQEVCVCKILCGFILYIAAMRQMERKTHTH
jgi:hypothetical protein